MAFIKDWGVLNVCIVWRLGDAGPLGAWAELHSLMAR